MSNDFEIEVLSKRKDVMPYVSTVQKSADTEKHALGFLPDGAYLDAAHQEKLLVAIASKDKETFFAGHLLFGGVFSHGRVFQIFAKKGFRKLGIAKTLVEKLVNILEDQNYLTISAKVGSDLHNANLVWSKLNFDLVRTVPGGKTRNRVHNVRFRELDTPSLLTWFGDSTEPAEVDLQLLDRLTEKSPTYVLDINVLLDVVKKRERAVYAREIFRAGFDNLVRIAVTEEFISELQRNSHGISNDPILAFSLGIRRLASPPKKTTFQISENLSPVVFPSRTKEKRLTIQDESDLKHLATAIHHKVAGFVTSEKAILQARNFLRSEFGIDVVGVVEFCETLVRDAGVKINWDEAKLETQALRMWLIAMSHYLLRCCDCEGMFCVHGKATLPS